MEDKVKKEEKAFVDGLIKDRASTAALSKLHKDPLPISIRRHTSLCKAFEDELQTLDLELPGIADGPKKVEALARKENITSELKKLENERIEGILCPLTYRDVNDIKAAITEAVVHFQEYKFDTDVVMARIAAEERYMTVFCALRQKSDRTKKVFESLDEIAGVEEATVYEIYSLWENHFVLTDAELKN